MLSIPFALASSGILMGSLLLIICAFLSIATSRFLIYAADEEYGKSQTKPLRRTPLTLVGEASYGSLAKIAFGNMGAFIVDLLLSITCFGFAVNCLIEFGDTFPKFISDLMGPPSSTLIPWYKDILYDRDFWIFVCLICVLPICLQDSVDNFPWFSSLCLGCSAYLIVIVLYLSIFPGKYVSSLNPLTPSSTPLSWTECVPILIFAFTCHQNLFSVHKEIGALYVGSPIPKKIINKLHDMITYASIACAIIYLLIGIFGYAAFGKHVDVIILNNCMILLFLYNNCKIVVTSPSLLLARLLFSVLSALTFTLQLHPCRASLDACILPFIQRISNRQGVLSFSEFILHDEGRKIALTFFLLVLCYVTAIQVDQVEKVLFLVGATGGVLICYILPLAFYFILVVLKR